MLATAPLGTPSSMVSSRRTVEWGGNRGVRTLAVVSAEKLPPCSGIYFKRSYGTVLRKLREKSPQNIARIVRSHSSNSKNTCKITYCTAIGMRAILTKAVGNGISAVGN